MGRRHHRSCESVDSNEKYQCHTRRGTKYVKKDTSDNDSCCKKGTRENPFVSLLEAELNGKWKELVVLASVPCYGPLDGGLKLEDGQELVGEGADPTAVGNVNKAWITNTTDRLDGSALVTEGDNLVKNLLIGEQHKSVKGDVIINAKKSGNLTLCYLKIVGDEEHEGTVIDASDNKKDGSIILNCVESSAVRRGGLVLSTKDRVVKYLCLSNSSLKNNIQTVVCISAKDKSEISINLNNVDLGDISQVGMDFSTEDEGTILDVTVKESSLIGTPFSIIYKPTFTSKCHKLKSKLIITDSVLGSVSVRPSGKGELLLVLKDNKISRSDPTSALTLNPSEDIYLLGYIKRNVVRGGILLSGDGELSLKLYDNKVVSESRKSLQIQSSDKLRVSLKAENNTFATSDSGVEAIRVEELSHEPVLDFGKGKLGSKGHNSILVDGLLPNAIVNSNGLVARRNWWGPGGPNVVTGPGVTVDVSEPLLKQPQQYCNC